MNENQQHILIVDDNIENLKVTAGILKNNGFSISLSQSGEKALELIEKNIPSLILLDIMMPDMDGYETCLKIKKMPATRDVPVIFLTAKTQTEDLVRGFNSGGVDYITKPFNSDELLVRVKTHLELKEARQKILDMNRMRDKLYSIIAHDLRGPFSAICQVIDSIDQGYLALEGDDFKEIISELNIATRETSNLLDNLLSWTRAQSENYKIRKEVVNIYALITDCIKLLGSNASAKSIEITLNIDMNHIAWCEETTIHTVFRNLISNAIKFTPHNGKINIASYHNEEDNICIDVNDTGIGISKEVLEKIFSKNEHHTSFGTDNESGTGLGLNVVKEFVRNNNGLLSVKSELGIGTTITVTLPIKENNE